MADVLTCAQCGHALTPKAKFCAECGTKVPLQQVASLLPGGERRQVTILFADITGYTRMSTELDPEELHALLGKYFAAVDGVVSDFGGTVDKHIGDAVMGVFGAPVSHGNDAERAVRAALAIHEVMDELSVEVGRPLSVHIGVANGEVVAAATGSSVHTEYTVLGDAVNLASRLDGIAQARQTVISEGVHQAVSHLVEAEAGGEVAVKGLSHPVRVFRVLGVQDAESPQSTPFVGRSAELDDVGALLDAVKREGTGAILRVRGEPGIGKTRLVAEIRQRAAVTGFAVHSGLVLDFGAGRTQDAVRSILCSALGAAPDAPQADIGSALQAAREHGHFASDEIPFANDLLRIPQPPALHGIVEAMSEEMRASVRSNTVARFLQRVAQEQPLLVVVEDVHWADRQTLETAHAIAVATREASLVLALTSRVDGDPLGDTWPDDEDTRALTLNLSPLGESAAAELAQSLGSVDAGRVRACVERAGGNPLFLEQLLRSDATGTLPDSVQSLVQARMDRLAPLDKRALQAAAVLGQKVSLVAVRHIIEDPNYDLRTLVERGLLKSVDSGWLFAHALLRDGVYSALLRPARRDLHQRAATWYQASEPVLFAEHLDRAEDARAPWAYAAAAQALMEGFDNDGALALLRRGASLATAEADHHVLALREGELMLDRSHPDAAVQAFERAVAHATTPLERCRAYVGLGDAYRIVEDARLAQEALEHARQHLSADGMHAERSRMQRILGSLEFAAARDSREPQLVALREAKLAGSVELEARALSCLGDAEYMAANCEAALDYFGQCLALCQEHGLGRVDLYQHYMIGLTRTMAGDLDAGKRSIQLGIDKAAGSGHRRAEMIAHETMALACLISGEYERALEETSLALELAEATQSARFRAVIWAERAEALHYVGKTEEARRGIETALATFESNPWWFAGPIVATAKAVLADSTTEVDRILDAGEARLSTEDGMMALLFHGRATQACWHAGHLDRVERHAARARSIGDSVWGCLVADCFQALVASRQDTSRGEVATRLEELERRCTAAGFGAYTQVIRTELEGLAAR